MDSINNGGMLVLMNPLLQTVSSKVLEIGKNFEKPYNDEIDFINNPIIAVSDDGQNVLTFFNSEKSEEDQAHSLDSLYEIVLLKKDGLNQDVKKAVDTAIRNAIAVGGNLEHLALLDNFCWCSL